MIEQLLRSLTTKADGSVEATREDTSVPQNTVRVKLTLRGNDCFAPDRGFVFYTGPGGAHSDPSTNSPIVAKPPVGGRLMFTGKTRSLSGETWFQVVPPGLPNWPQVEQPQTAWISSDEVSCTRPVVPTPRPTHNDTENLPLGAGGEERTCGPRGPQCGLPGNQGTGPRG